MQTIICDNCKFEIEPKNDNIISLQSISRIWYTCKFTDERHEDVTELDVHFCRKECLSLYMNSGMMTLADSVQEGTCYCTDCMGIDSSLHLVGNIIISKEYCEYCDGK